MDMEFWDLKNKKMNRKAKAILYFIPTLLSNYKAFLKIMFAFVENKMSEQYCKSRQEIKFISLQDLLPNLNESIKSYTYLDGTSFPIDIAFIKGIVSQFEDCNYLEIGSCRGESLVNIVPSAKTVTSVSLSKEQMLDMGFDIKNVEIEGCLIPADMNYRQIYHNSLTFDFSTLDQKFDVIFVDGDHSTNAVEIDTKNAFKLLKDENSIIVWHDCGNTVNDYRYEVIEGILKGSPSEAHPYIYRVQNTLCGIYTRKRLKFSEIVNKNRPIVLFDIDIKSKAVSY